MTDYKIVRPTEDVVGSAQIPTVGDASNTVQDGSSRIGQQNMYQVPANILQGGNVVEIGERTIETSNELDDWYLSTDWGTILLTDVQTVNELLVNDIIIINCQISYLIEEYEGKGIQFNFSINGTRLTHWFNHIEHGYDGSNTQEIDNVVNMFGFYTVPSRGQKTINVQHKSDAGITNQSVTIQDIALLYSVYRLK